jgi:lysophospholipase L1-like esterase
VIPLSKGNAGRFGAQRVHLPPEGQVLRLAPVTTGPGMLECNGFDLESDTPGGVIVDTAGVGGSAFRSWLRGEYFVEQLAMLSPDLVILDLGTNDYLAYDRIEPDQEKQMRALIRKVRMARPSASILLTTTQDMAYNGRPATVGEAFVTLVHKIAADEGCAVWDWYHLTGGTGTALSWRDAGLMGKDLIHLSRTGYTKKGEALSESIIDAIQWMEANPTARRRRVE